VGQGIWTYNSVILHTLVYYKTIKRITTTIIQPSQHAPSLQSSDQRLEGSNSKHLKNKI